MKAKELADKLLQYPDFNVSFSFMEPDGSHYGICLRSFNDIDIADIGHSDKVIVLGGEER